MAARQALPLLLGAVALATTACDDFRPAKQQTAAVKAPVAAAAPPVVDPNAAAPALAVTPSATDAAMTASASAPASDLAPAAPTPIAQSIEEAKAGGPPPSAAKPSPLLIKTEVLLDRARFSPGVIDGRPGENLTNALKAYRAAHNLGAGDGIDAAVLTDLAADKGAITQAYIVTESDEAGPFIGKVPAGFLEQSKLKALGYTDPVQALAAKFHMSEPLLKALNPGADFTKVGGSLVVVQPGTAPLPKVARVEVDKAANQVRALDGAGKILAAFPATVGSTERPAPSGQWAVRAVAPHPDYTYDPKKLTFGDRSQGVLTLPPGPNNPVGSTWIALTKETYGIHGTPDPAKVGKTASHGCVRLTNWDAETLGKAVSKGTPVVFVGETTKS